MSEVHIVSKADPCICPECPVLASITPSQRRHFEPITHDQFSAILESGDFMSYHEVNGFRMIQMQQATLLSNGDSCAMIRAEGANMDLMFQLAFARLDTDDLLAA